MKIAILGLFGTFDYFQIGGTDSYIRRLTCGLLESEYKTHITCILYKADEDTMFTPLPGLVFFYYTTFEKAIQNIISSSYTHVLCTWLSPIDRLKFAKFRRRMKFTNKFHNILFFYPEMVLKRLMKFSEFICVPYNGNIFCVSKRQYRFLKRATKRVKYLPPIVPDEYFAEPKNEYTPENRKINITFLGRIDPRKGINEVIKLFKKLNSNKTYSCSIHGIYIPGDKEAVDIRNWLQQQQTIKYIETDRQRFSPRVDQMVRDVLSETDIFLQPYTSLNTTVDTPLLLLEAMASSCAVITTGIGNVGELYGPSKFLIEGDCFVNNALELLKRISLGDIAREKGRVCAKIKKMNIRSGETVNRFVKWIN